MNLPIRFLAAALLLLAIDWYAFQAVRLLLGDPDDTAYLLVTVVYWCLPVLAIGYIWGVMRGLVDRWPGSVHVVLRTLIVILYFSKLMIVLALLVDDLRRLIWLLLNSVFDMPEAAAGRSRLLSQIGVGLGIVPLALLTYGMVRNPYRYRVHRHTIPLTGLPLSLEGLTIVQISDIHAGSFIARDPVRRSVSMINALEPDLVFFTGDLVNSSADEADDFIDIFSQIRARYGVFSILGNHDYGDYQRWPSPEAKRANFEKLLHQHRRLGWHLLLNEHVVVEIGGDKVGIIGVENYSAYPRFPKYGDLQAATAGMPDTAIRILLSHDPSHWKDEVLRSYPGIGLTLSGHTHGFQFGVDIPGLIKWSPVQYIYRQWAGLYQEGHQYLYVNRGLGYLGYPGRVGILPEITLLTIRSER